jgi:hypothetical protein
VLQKNGFHREQMQRKVGIESRRAGMPEEEKWLPEDLGTCSGDSIALIEF